MLLYLDIRIRRYQVPTAHGLADSSNRLDIPGLLALRSADHIMEHLVELLQLKFGDIVEFSRYLFVLFRATSTTN